MQRSLVSLSDTPWWANDVLAHGEARGAKIESFSRNHLLVLLALIYSSSFADRAILNVLAESIKRDLALTDTELGVLGGIAFAALYSVLGIPIARVAERRARLPIITI